VFLKINDKLQLGIPTDKVDIECSQVFRLKLRALS
jgi:hypothetical protein